MSELDARQAFLLAEYEQANKLTYHVDELRNKVTTVFLAFAGAAGAGLTIYARGEGDSLPVDVAGTVAFLVLFVALIGILVVLVLARLRRAQLEHFRIINNIRCLFLSADVSAWNAVELSVSTLPTPTRGSGTYYWFAQVAATVAFLAATATYLFLVAAEVSSAFPRLVLGGVAAALMYFLLDRTYLHLAKAPPVRSYPVAPVPRASS